MKKERSVFGTRFLSIVGCFVIVISTVVAAQGIEMGSYTINCRDGSQRTCTGDRCTGEDNNGCQCSNNDGSSERKMCPRVVGFETVDAPVS